MKRYIHYILVLLCLFSPATQAVAQEEEEEQKVFFVHRNDGDFNAFFFDQIDSIVYSKIDVDSILREDYVTQEIWMADTVVRIPVAAIDSTTFQTPSTIYKKGTTVLDESRRNWIEKADSLTLYYSLSTPISFVPQVGDRLVTTDMDDLFPIGFIGRVKSVSRNSEYIVVDCDEINLSEVFDRYYCIVEGKCEKMPDGKYRIRKVRVENTVPLMPVELEEEVSFEYGWRENEYCSLGAGASVGVSISIEPTLSYVYVNEYGDQFVSLKMEFDQTLSTTTSLFGKFTVEKDIDSPVKVDIPIEAIPLTKFYLKTGARFEFTGSLALDFDREDVFHCGYVFNKGTNPGIHYQNRFIPLQHVSGNHDIRKLMGEVSVYGGLFLEVGYGLLIEDWGKVYARIDGGLESVVEADLAKSLDDAPTSTRLYDEAGDLVTYDLNMAYGSSAGIGMEVGNFSAGVSVGEMTRANLLSVGLFPSFSEAEYVQLEDGNNYLTCDIENNMLLPVPVGFKVIDEDGKVVFVEYNDKNYYNFSFHNYKIPYTFDKINTRCMAYPVFKLFGEYEILASPGVELSNMVKPVTDATGEVTSSDAVINGHIESENKIPGKYTVGFFYGLSPNPQETGSNIVASLNAERQFAASLSELKDGETYYYCAYLKAGDKCYYGEVCSFETPKIPDDAVDLGLSVLWAKYNVGARSEGERGDLYGWADATGTNTSFDVVGSDGVTWVSSLYGGTNPPASICGNAAYDIAANLWGGSWRLPSQTEMAELINNCTTEFVEVEGTTGMRFTSVINGNSVFFPAAGYRFGDDYSEGGYTGDYWTGTLVPENKVNAYRMTFGGGDAYVNSYPRYIGHSVRAVLPRKAIR